MNQKQKVKAYTLLEMIIVIIILTLLIWAFSSFMPSKNNKQIEFWETCSQYIYQEIVTEINDLKRNKIENIDWVEYSQNLKELNIDINKININKKMINNLTKADYEAQKIIITWNQCLSDNIKNTNNYLIKIDQAETLIFSAQDIYISNNNMFEISTCIDTWNNNTCIPSSQIIFNQATQTIDQNLCINFSWDTCNEWSK